MTLLVFCRFLIFSIILLNNECSTLLSPLRSRQDYLPQSDLEIIKNLDDKTYEDLLHEIPILRKVFKGNRKDKSFQYNPDVLPLYEEEDAGQPYSTTLKHDFHFSSFAADPLPKRSYSNQSLHVTKKTITYRTRWSSPRKISRRHEYWWRDKYYYMISCYWCGLNETRIPKSAVCYNLFNSDDTSARGLTRFFRARCYYYDYYEDRNRQIIMMRWYPPRVGWKWDPGLKRNMFGPYMKGCFKRFLDVGPLYTTRGCRGGYMPKRSYTPNFASHRHARLEVITRGHQDVCVTSPEATLTPFSRAISLWVRYHVCVCPTSYCNRAPRSAPGRLLALLPLLLTIQH